MKWTATLLLIAFFGTISYAQNANFANNQVIVQFKDAYAPNATIVLSQQEFTHPSLIKIQQDYPLKSINGIRRRGGISKTEKKNTNKTFILTFKAQQDIMAMVRAYEATGNFIYVEPNFKGKGHGQRASTCNEPMSSPSTTPDDIYYYLQWSHYNDGSFAFGDSEYDADIDLQEAWDIETGDEDMIIAILDSGVKLDHPEFSGRIWQNLDETNNANDDDNNSYVGDYQGWDYAYDDNDPADDFGHGTNVAGLLGATGNNNLGYAGVNWNSKIMVCKILDNENWGLYTWWAEAIYYAVDNGAKVINLSVGGDNFSQTLADAVAYAHDNGVVMVASMGNTNDSQDQYPAKYSETIAVGATDPNDERSNPFFWSSISGSNYGNHIDLVASGNYMYGLDYDDSDNYGSNWGGTSQATPLVAGVASLLLAIKPTLGIEDIRTILKETSDDMVGNPTEDVAGWDVYHGAGRLNAYAALQHDLTSSTALEEYGHFTITPNPTKGNALLSMNLTEPLAFDIQIYNALGQEVKSLPLQNLGVGNHQYPMDLNSLSQGIYFIQIQSQHQTLTKKILIQK